MNFAAWLKSQLFGECATKKPTKRRRRKYWRGYYVVSLKSGKPVGCSSDYVNALRLLSIARRTARCPFVMTMPPGELPGPEDLRPDRLWLAGVSPAENHLRALDFVSRN